MKMMSQGVENGTDFSMTMKIVPTMAQDEGGKTTVEGAITLYKHKKYLIIRCKNI